MKTNKPPVTLLFVVKASFNLFSGIHNNDATRTHKILFIKIAD